MSKHDPASKEDLFQYALLKLGHPIHVVEIHDDQFEVALTEAMDLFERHHFDATESVYYAKLIAAEDKTNGYFTLPDHIIDVERILTFNGRVGAEGLFWIPGGSSIGLSGWMVTSGVAGGYGNVDVGVGAFGLTNLVEMYLQSMQAAEYEALFVAETPVRFNSISKRLFLDAAKSKLEAGKFLAVEATSSLYKRNDPTVWKSDWLRRYFVALCKRQWGENVSKYDGNTMGLNDVKLNWQKIVQEAERDCDRLREELETKWCAPLGLWYG